MNNNVEVLDCTLRDGSYLINFQFNTNDTYQISKLIEQAGLKYIEVGHGLGLDAGKDKGGSLENDLDYIRAAKQAVTTSKIGVFYIPGIGQMETIKQAVDAGLDFIRIGVNVTDYKKAEETINYAKGLGLEVWLNLMKTYTVTHQEWRTICEYLKTMKCDHLAVVDSAGGMLPQDVKTFCQIAKEITPFGIGFHGHNNMQLAIANCLAAIEGGATIVDGTLFGMGRSGGNASTEILAAIFKREGIIPANKYDTELLIEIANEMIAPISRKNLGDGAVELAAGVNYFHSSFFSTVKKGCDEASSSIFRTILNLPKESRVAVTKEMVASTIDNSKNKKALPAMQRLKESNTLYIKDFAELSKYIREVSSKTNCRVALSVSQTSTLVDNFRVSNIYTLEDTIVGHIEFSDLNNLPTLVENLKNQVHFWFLDIALKGEKLINQLPAQHYFFFDENQLEQNVLINELINSSKKILCLKDNAVIADPRYSTHEVSTNGNLLVLENNYTEISDKTVSQLSENDQIIMTHKCAISESTWKLINDKKINVMRLNYTLPLAYEVLKIIKNKEIVQASRGKAERNGIEIVSGGFVSKKGAVIVDSVKNPTIILGLTDGQGGVEVISSNLAKLQEIRNEIFFDTK
jgi:4-hydroxy 2-oxovalerate aldolase